MDLSGGTLVDATPTFERKALSGGWHTGSYDAEKVHRSGFQREETHTYFVDVEQSSLAYEMAPTCSVS